MEKVKIIYVLASLDVCNGMVSYAMNYFRAIDKSKFQIDFIISSEDNSPYYNEIISSGSNIYIMPDLKIKNTFKLITKIDDFFCKNKYDIIHCHIANAGGFYLRAAKKYGVRKRILHSHATKSADKMLKRLRNDMMIPVAKKYANINFACTKDAGDYLFDKDYIIIKNAINLKKYDYDLNIRNKKRKELGIEGKFVVGNVGRFSAQKNPIFTIDIFNEIYRRNSNAVLLMIGDGPLEYEVKAKINQYNLNNCVIILSHRTDINELYQAMDTFVLPSLYEGLGIVYIEAQVSGLTTFASKQVPKDAKVSDKMHFLSLKDSASIWANKILEYSYVNKRIGNIECAAKSGYDIGIEAKKLEDIYSKLLEE